MIPYKASPTLEAFHIDNTFVRGVMGCFASGKSVGMCWEIYIRSKMMPALKDGFRHSKWVVVRNTKEQLKDTTIQTWLEWFPDGVAGRYAVSDMTFHLEYEDVKAEILFRALDKPDDVRKLLSLELTGAFVNEAREVPWAIVDGLTGRVGRYPRHRDFEHIKPESVTPDENDQWRWPDGTLWEPYRSFIIMDTNPPDEDHWWYRKFEIQAKQDKQVGETYKLFRQPPGVIKEDDRWVTNPKAENLANLKPGYYENMVVGKDPEWIKVYAQGEYGIVSDGRPVYSGYNDQLHCAEFDVDPRLPVHVGWDYSFHGQACVLAQLSPAGQLRVFQEFCGTKVGLQSFVLDVVKPGLTKFGPLTFQTSTGDPAGAKRGDLDEKFALAMLNDGYEDMPLRLPFSTYPADTNSLGPRIDGVNHFINRLIDGAPAFLLHPRCAVLRKGFLGRYEFKRVQVVGEDRYKDVPDKSSRYSHCFVGDTPVSTPNGPVSIQGLRLSDLVNTPIGPKRVTAIMSRVPKTLMTVNGLTCTPDHPFATDCGFVRADALQYTTGYIYSEHHSWDDHQFTQYRNSTAFGITGSRADTTHPIFGTRVGSTSTGWFGKMLTERFRRAIMSITKMVTEPITDWATWSASQPRNTWPYTLAAGLQRRCWRSCVNEPRSGIGPKRAGNGTESTPFELRNLFPWRAMTVRIAARRTVLRKGAARKGFAPQNAKPLRGSRRAWTILIRIARNAVAPFASTNIARKNTVRPIVGNPFDNVEQKRVYDITVEDAHVFYAGGLLVSNCQDGLQYLCRGILNDTEDDEEDYHEEYQPPRSAYSG